MKEKKKNTTTCCFVSLISSTFFMGDNLKIFHFKCLHYFILFGSSFDNKEPGLTWKPCLPLHQPVSSLGGMSMTDTMSPTCAPESRTVTTKSNTFRRRSEVEKMLVESSVRKLSPQRSTHHWPEPCSAWSRGRQRWRGHWWRPPLTPADGSPCCQSGKGKCQRGLRLSS